MTITTLPNDMIQETFQYLTTAQLQPMSVVSKWSYERVHYELRTRMPDIPVELRFCRNAWNKQGFKGLESRIIDFINRNPTPGKISCLKVTFDNCPEAYITVWMGEGVKFPCNLLQSSDEIQAALENSSAPVIEKGYVVSGGVVQTYCNKTTIRPPEIQEDQPQYRVHYGVTVGRITLPQYNQGTMGYLKNELHIFPVKYMPDRWYWTTHRKVVGWGQDLAFQNVCMAAEDRIYALDCEDLQPENMIKRAANNLATALSTAFAGLTAAVTVLQHLQ